MDLERICHVLDLVAAGRQAGHRIPEESRTDPRVRRTLTLVGWLIGLLFLIGGAAVAEALLLTAEGETVSGLVKWRLLVVFAIAVTLFYFLWRARLGYWWAYSRLRLFSVVFPVVAIGTSLVPGLYPAWMIIEQVAFSVVLLVVFWLLNRPHLKAAFPRPPRAPRHGRTAGASVPPAES